MTGGLAMTIAALLPLAHDVLIIYSSTLGFTAFATTLFSLFQSKEFKLFFVALISILFCIANFLMWRTGYMLTLMPLVQKLAFLSFFIWIALTVNRYSRATS